MYNSDMEMANGQDAVYRMAKQEDWPNLSRLIGEADYGYRYADWYGPEDWIDKPTFIIGERQAGGASSIVSCLAVDKEVPPAGWVRVAAVRHRRSGFQRLHEMLELILPEMHAQGVTKIGWLAATGWPKDLLREAGFSIINWITSYQGSLTPKFFENYDDIKIRPAGKADIESMAAIEFHAFEPIWRMSSRSLENAFKQSLSYDVALLEGVIVGFQISARGYLQRSGHLVRITVHPDAQGRGVGSSLLSEAMRGYRAMGLESISLNTQINNTASHRLYERFGFKLIGEQIPLYLRSTAVEE